MAVTKNDLHFYLTGNDPFGSISDTSQSIGGYLNTLYAPTQTLQSNMTGNSNSVSAIPVSSPTYALIGSEVVYVNPSTVITRGALSTLIGSHISGEPVTLLNKPLFNNALSDNLEQFRCVAIKNNSTSSTFFNLNMYVKENSLTDDTQISIAIEVPVADYKTGIATNGSIITVVDPALEIFANNRFSDCVITITSGNNINQSRLILSSDQATGTLVLDSALPFSTLAGDKFSISPSPSQRIVSGIDTPSDTSYISDFVTANSLATAVNINVSGMRSSGKNLHPNQVVYLWIKRKRNKNAVATLNNRIVISANYGVS